MLIAVLATVGCEDGPLPSGSFEFDFRVPDAALDGGSMDANDLGDGGDATLDAGDAAPDAGDAALDGGPDGGDASADASSTDDGGVDWGDHERDGGPDGGVDWGDVERDATPRDAGTADWADHEDGGLDEGLVDLGVDASAPDASPADASPPDAGDVCEPGTFRVCGDALGRCGQGLQACEPFGFWGPCQDAVEAEPERCNNIDDDCDGRIDETLAEVCGSDVGDCRPGRRRCFGGQWTLCDGGQFPGIEVCDGFDDDCDGLVDESLVRDCGSNQGLCELGQETCNAGTWSACEGGVRARAETCDGADEDCDGTTDESIFQACDQVGRCEGEFRRCEDGVFGACDGAERPVPEACNNQDDDCDGAIDEATTRACGLSAGNCVAGEQICDAGIWGPCEGATEPVDETCDSTDEDCDGQVDEAVAPQACAPQAGVCVPGVRRCLDGLYGACEGAVGGVEEACNGEDDDCDGATDEGLTPEPCGVDVGQCQAGVRACEGGVRTPCDGVAPEDERCNLLDDDCDGETDERLFSDGDGDGLSDCVEWTHDLDPADPSDALGDFDHDGTSNGAEISVGTPLWSMLYLHAVPYPDDPSLRAVSVRLYQPNPALRPDIAEIRVHHTGARLVATLEGQATVEADKIVVGQPFQAEEARIVIVAPNLNPINSGELARLVLRPVDLPLRLRIVLDETQFAPIDAQTALIEETAAHSRDLVVP